MYLFLIPLFLIGACFGSFFGVLADRLPRRETVTRGRSKCESCGHVLEPIDLIPLVSYLSLGGRCRYCKAKLPSRLLIVELIGGLCAVGVFYYVTTSLLPLVYFVFLFLVIMSFIGIFIADQATGIIPDEFIVLIVASTLLALITLRPDLIIESFMTGFISFFIFFALFALTRGRGMGFGDVKLAFAIGFFLGFPRVVVGFYAAFLTAMFAALILVVLGRKKLHGGKIAFGPFLALGAIVAFFTGTRIIDFLFK